MKREVWEATKAMTKRLDDVVSVDPSSADPADAGDAIRLCEAIIAMLRLR